METELRCPMCRDYFVEPVMLQCTHHICVAHLSTHGNQGHLACPVCGDFTMLPPEGSLRVDRTLQVVVDVYKEKVLSPEQNGGDNSPLVPPAAPPLCGFCEENPATRHCIQCEGVLCEDCERSSHSKGFFKSHNVVDFSVEGQEASREKGTWSARMLCDDHAGEKLQFYCLDCRKPVCPHCLILGEHKGHQNTPIDQAAETGKDTLNAWVDKLRQRISAAEELLERLRSDEQEVQQNAEVQRNLINTELDHLRELIETKRQQLLSKSALEEKQKRVSLQSQVDKAEVVRGESSSLVSRSSELLDLPSEHAFLAVLLPLIQDMKKCASLPVDTSQQVSCAFRPLSTDSQVRSLGDLDLGHPRQPVAIDNSLHRLQSVATHRQPHGLAGHSAAIPGLLAQPGSLAQFEGMPNSFQMPLPSDAGLPQANYSMLPGYASAQQAGQHATMSYVGSHQLPPAQQSSPQAQAAMLGQGGISQNVYVYRSVHQG